MFKLVHPPIPWHCWVTIQGPSSLVLNPYDMLNLVYLDITKQRTPNLPQGLTGKRADVIRLKCFLVFVFLFAIPKEYLDFAANVHLIFEGTNLKRKKT